MSGARSNLAAAGVHGRMRCPRAGIIDLKRIRRRSAPDGGQANIIFARRHRTFHSKGARRNRAPFGSKVVIDRARWGGMASGSPADPVRRRRRQSAGAWLAPRGALGARALGGKRLRRRSAKTATCRLFVPPKHCPTVNGSPSRLTPSHPPGGEGSSWPRPTGSVSGCRATHSIIAGTLTADCAS